MHGLDGMKSIEEPGDGIDKEKLARCNSDGSIYSLASFLKPGMFEDGTGGSYTELPDAGSMDAKPEVVAGWALALKNLLVDQNGVALFLKYCSQLLCEENLLFWQAVQEFKSLEDPEQVQAAGQSIFNNFIHHTGKHQVNLNSKTSKAVKAAVKEPYTNQLYDSCQTEIFQLMKTDSYPKFLQSELYKEVLCLELEGKRLPWQESDEPTTCPRKKGFLSFLRKDKRKGATGALAPYPEDRKASVDAGSAATDSLVGKDKDKKFHIRTKSSAGAFKELQNQAAKPDQQGKPEPRLSK